MTRPWTGGIAAGSRDFTAAEAQRVLSALSKHRGATQATSLELFCRVVDMPARTVRAILTAYDGKEYALHLQGDGDLYIAEYQDEAERTTRQLWSRSRKLMDRAKRREAYASTLPRRQGFLFSLDEDFDDDDE